MTKDKDVKWMNVDVESLPAPIAKLYAKYKAQYALMKEAREAFEDAFAGEVSLPPGKRVAFGYKFGKLSVGVVDAGKAKADAKTATLSDFIAAQERSGRRA